MEKSKLRIYFPRRGVFFFLISVALLSKKRKSSLLVSGGRDGLVGFDVFGPGGVLFWGVCDWWIGGVCVLFFLWTGL